MGLTRKTGLLLGAMAVPITVMLSKVFSAQYLLFSLPMLLMVFSLSGKRSLWLTLLCGVITTLTGAVFPYLWFAEFPGTQTANPFCLFPDLHPLPIFLLGIRNALFAALVFIALRYVIVGGARCAPSNQQMVNDHVAN